MRDTRDLLGFAGKGSVLLKLQKFCTLLSDSNWHAAFQLLSLIMIYICLSNKLHNVEV